jgi:hypothetical protein
MWGHFLRKMPSERATRLWDRFMGLSVSEYKYQSSELRISYDSSGLINKKFENLLEVTPLKGSFYNLNQEQYDLCLRELIKEELLLGDQTNPFMLSKSVQISKWKIQDQDILTDSWITLNVGDMPFVTTFLQFDSVENFLKVKEILEEIKFFKLNEKHLKLRKSKK